MATVETIRPSRSRSNSPPHKRARLDTSVALEATIASTSTAPQTNNKKNKKKNKRPPPPEPCSPEDVNLRDICEVLGEEAVAAAVKNGSEYAAPIALYTEIELEIKDITSHGEAIALLPNPTQAPWAVLVPFCVPGETVIAKIYRHARLHSYADLVRVVTPNPALRDDSLVRCKYFGTCGGCQYQMISYETQLAFKKRVVEKAYTTYSLLPSSSVPSVLPTIPSPKQYGYRTKITPHFDAAPKPVQKAYEAKKQKAAEGEDVAMDWDPKIGFDQKGRRTVMDIEECPIATPVLNEEMTVQRRKVKDSIHTYKRASSLLLRDSISLSSPSVILDDSAAPQPAPSEIEPHIAVTSHKVTVRERVGQMLYDFPAGSFFQNNNSVLEPLVSYVREAIFGPSSHPNPNPNRPTHLVDTYCGSGLFAISLSPFFQHIAGIEIDPAAIKCATHNLALNGLDITHPDGKKKHAFHAGKSEDIFAAVLKDSEEAFPAQKTAVVIDPPRKGCDEGFIDQVVAFHPAVLVYVSCNVHTQARDVGMLIRKMDEASGGERTYVLESLRGFDLFPQTAHVESVAVLRLKDNGEQVPV